MQYGNRHILASLEAWSVLETSFMDDLLEILERSLNGEYKIKLEERPGMTIIRCYDKAGVVVASRSLSQEQRASRELAALVIDDLILTVTQLL